MGGRQVEQRRGRAHDRVEWSRGDEDGREEEEGPDYEGKIKAARCAAVGRAHLSASTRAWRDVPGSGTAAEAHFRPERLGFLHIAGHAR